METMEDHPQEQWEDLAVGEGDLKITVHQGVGADTLEEEAALIRVKPEGGGGSYCGGSSCWGASGGNSNDDGMVQIIELSN